MNKRKIRAIGTVPEKDQVNEAATQSEEELEPPYVGFGFVSVGTFTSYLPTTFFGLFDK